MFLSPTDHQDFSSSTWHTWRNAGTRRTVIFRILQQKLLIRLHMLESADPDLEEPFLCHRVPFWHTYNLDVGLAIMLTEISVSPLHSVKATSISGH